MASGGPMMNGDISRSPGQSGTLEETLHQMNILIQENRELKEALRQTNLTMKDRFEGLSAWREKQRAEREFLESRLEEARSRMETLTLQNQELSKRLEETGRPEGAPGGWQATSYNQSGELEALRAQVARLQAEKNDLVAMNSELQLKAEQDSHDDSFIEIIKVSDEGIDSVNNVCGMERSRRPELSMTASRMDSEEVTVSQLLQSLRNETQQVERLQAELRVSAAIIRELEERKSIIDQSTQTAEPEPTEIKEDKAASEVENLKSQMMMLFKELQQAQSKLDEAEGMKKNLQDRCREVEQDVATLKAQLVEKQAVQSENNRLKLQLESMQAQNQIEQKKAGEDRNTLAQLKDAYTKLFEDYNELKEEKKKRESQLVQREVVDELQERLTVAEQALAAKQSKIDEMKHEIFQKEKELETISVFKAQVNMAPFRFMVATIFFFSFRLFPFRGRHSESSASCLTLSSASSSLTLHVLSHYIHKSPLWSSSRPPAWQLQPQHLSTNIFTISPLNMSKPPQSGLSDFISRTSNMICPSDVLIPDPIRPRHSQREPQHLLPPVFSLVPLSLSRTASLVSPLS